LVAAGDTQNMNHDTAKILSFFCLIALLGACGPTRPHHAGVTERYIRAVPPASAAQDTPPIAEEEQEPEEEAQTPPANETIENVVPEPQMPSVCEQIINVAGACPGYGYNCAAEPQIHSQCFLDTLLGYQNPCMLFYEQPLCSNTQVSDYGIGSCLLQECFGMNTALACYENLEMLCEWT
jgi:hypothetical protein